MRTRTGLASMFAVAVVFVVAGPGCGSENLPAIPLPGSTGGAGGDMTTMGGAGGSGGPPVGVRFPTGNSGGAPAPPPGPAPTPPATVDPGSIRPIPPPMGGSGPAPSPGTGGRAGSAPPALPPPPAPVTPNPTRRPDAGPADGPMTGPVPGTPPPVGNGCRIDCPGLFNVVATCFEGTDETCTENFISEDPEVLAQCFPNGVKRYGTFYEEKDPYREAWRVTRPGGAACYTIDISELNDEEDVWVWKSPTGQELGRAVDGKKAMTFTCTSTGKTFEVDDYDCPGFDLEPFCDEDPICK
jgi:hypothetical protein